MASTASPALMYDSSEDELIDGNLKRWIPYWGVISEIMSDCQEKRTWSPQGKKIILPSLTVPAAPLW